MKIEARVEDPYSPRNVPDDTATVTDDDVGTAAENDEEVNPDDARISIDPFAVVVVGSMKIPVMMAAPAVLVPPAPQAADVIVASDEVLLVPNSRNDDSVCEEAVDVLVQYEVNRTMVPAASPAGSARLSHLVVVDSGNVVTVVVICCACGFHSAFPLASDFRT